jgi:energy-coupling factor transporter ATP-binding protein EcfA2
MGPLDLPGSVLSSQCPTWPISANSGRGPWSGANFLVVGPAGSGKLSLVRALSLASDPRTRLVLLDFETEHQSQHALLDQLTTHLAENREKSEERSSEAIVFRHIHRLSQEALAELVRTCRGFSQVGDRAPVVFHATSHCFSDYPRPLKNELRSLFNCLIQWSGFPRTETRIRQFVSDVIADLNRRYGQHILGVDPPVVNFVQRFSQRANLYELRNVIERAYFREESSCLSVEAVVAACPSTLAGVSPRRTEQPDRLRRTASHQPGGDPRQNTMLKGVGRRHRARPPHMVSVHERPSGGSIRQDRMLPSEALQPTAGLDRGSRNASRGPKTAVCRDPAG